MLSFYFEYFCKNNEYLLWDIWENILYSFGRLYIFNFLKFNMKCINPKQLEFNAYNIKLSVI